jgi:hypothetical protein
MSGTRARPGDATLAAPGGLALFADCLLVGVCAAVAAVPLVTGPAALVAACATVGDRVRWDHTAGPRAYGRHLLAAIRSGPVGVLVMPVLVGGVLALDALAVASGVPGAAGLAVLLAGCAVAAVVVGLRAAAGWRPGRPWPAVVSSAARRALGDPGGSALLLAAAAASAVIVAMVPLTALLIGGPLALAAVAVDGRRPADGRGQVDR